MGGLKMQVGGHHLRFHSQPERGDEYNGSTQRVRANLPRIQYGQCRGSSPWACWLFQWQGKGGDATLQIAAELLLAHGDPRARAAGT